MQIPLSAGRARIEGRKINFDREREEKKESFLKKSTEHIKVFFKKNVFQDIDISSKSHHLSGYVSLLLISYI